MAALVEETFFRYRDAGNYKLHCYVIMPDHIHFILTPGATTSLERAVQLIKGGSSFQIGKMPGMRFPVWHMGFTEHQIRDKADFDIRAKYIDQNPVKAGLVRAAEEYPYGSAAGRFVLDAWPIASGAEAPANGTETAGLKPRPSESAR
jgi:putative transposase